MVGRHRRHIGSPHLLVRGFNGSDRRSVLSKQVRHHQRHQVGTVGRHQHRLHHRRLDRFKLGYHRRSLSGRLLGLDRRRGKPRRIGAAAAAIADDDAPCHAPPTSPDVTEPKEAAAEANSMANPSQAVAAAAIGSGPAPANISAELISGGSTEKFIVQPSLRAPRDQR